MAPIDFEFQIQVVQPHPAFIVEPLAGRFINVMTTTRVKPIKPVGSVLIFICFGFHVEASFHMTSSRNHSDLHGTIKTSIESAPSM